MADDAVLTGAAPQFTHDDIVRLVSESYGVTGEVRRTLNSERDQVVLLAGEERELVVKLSNESESRTNIDLEEAAALWAVAADPDLPLSTPLAVRGTDARHAVVEHPATGASHFLRAYDRLPGRASLRGADLTGSTVVEYGATTARTARAMRGFYHPAARPPRALARRGAGADPRAPRPHLRSRVASTRGGGVRRLRGAGGAPTGRACARRPSTATSPWTTFS